jgi:hypothetical protein
MVIRTFSNCVRCGSDKDARLAHQACRPSRSVAARSWNVARAKPAKGHVYLTALATVLATSVVLRLLAPYIPNVYSTPYSASAIKSHIQLQNMRITQVLAANNATCDCLVLERPAPVPPYYHESQLFDST